MRSETKVNRRDDEAGDTIGLRPRIQLAADPLHHADQLRGRSSVRRLHDRPPGVRWPVAPLHRFDQLQLAAGPGCELWRRGVPAIEKNRCKICRPCERRRSILSLHRARQAPGQVRGVTGRCVVVLKFQALDQAGAASLGPFKLIAEINRASLPEGFPIQFHAGSHGRSA